MALPPLPFAILRSELKPFNGYAPFRLWVNMVVGVLSWHSWFVSFTTFLAGYVFKSFSCSQCELELPFLALLLVIVAPYQAMNLRGMQAGAIISLARAGFLALQHFSRVGSLQQAFDQRSVVATLSVICITVVPCLLLF
ncbi:cold-regulated 413 inner membrane protein 2, chloroplastic-like [Magnolia sinica]|uniref:cold-regulated 413 inner membrane protein 2, chloroplastic-like n=1 Tax=Magnolia sinica TaxID=86752 RepID=UPI00265A95EA|nr:cold-regulated 413 inner membrane protein 2, chloroplastic-like [Magnolia sinica]